MWPTICPKLRTSGVGLKEYCSSGTFSADLMMLPLIKSKVALVAPVSGLAGVCAAAGAARASTATRVHAAFITDLLFTTGTARNLTSRRMGCLPPPSPNWDEWRDQAATRGRRAAAGERLLEEIVEGLARARRPG